jgi:hypothetical protein
MDKKPNLDPETTFAIVAVIIGCISAFLVGAFILAVLGLW